MILSIYESSIQQQRPCHEEGSGANVRTHGDHACTRSHQASQRPSKKLCRLMGMIYKEDRETEKIGAREINLFLWLKSGHLGDTFLPVRQYESGLLKRLQASCLRRCVVNRAVNLSFNVPNATFTAVN